MRFLVCPVALFLFWGSKMPEYKLRYEETNTGCFYCWDEEKERWVKVCPVDELPSEIRKKVLADKQRAELVISVKI
jgi:hypothetical protein